MPNFKYSLDGSIPKIFSGGWAKESTEHQLPESKGTPSPKERLQATIADEGSVTDRETMRVSNHSNSTVRAGRSQERLSRLMQLRELQRVPTLRP